MGSSVGQREQDHSLETDSAPDRRAPTVAAPRGIVTFVFTDIEGSTRLFRQLGDDYADLLRRHRRLLREAWDAHEGYEVGTEGDSFFVAFDRADDALRACIAGQRSLGAEGWPHEGEVRVRMGIHTGLASPQDGGYVALAVHETARVMSSAHGGQILLTHRTLEALGDREGLEFRRLGRFKLRGFDDPVRLYQVAEPGLQQDFPAVRALPADGHNVVRNPTETIGREDVIAAVVDGLAPRRLVTLVGPGGVGKTRVASEVGVRAAPAWKDGVWLVDLAGVTEPGLVPGAVADTIGASAHLGDRWEDVLDHLETRRTVIVLDGCEQVASACRELVSSLFGSCDGVGVLATSREPLRVPGEVLRRIAPLPAVEEPHPTAAEVLASPAGRLFAERGASVRPGFTVTDDNARAVAEICRRLDGLPLLIELAAAHLSAQSPAEILAGLEDRFRILRSPDATLPERHRTVEGLLEWSYRLLDERQRTAFRRLSVFATGFSMRSASPAVTGGGIDDADVPQLLWLLADRSLVVADLGADETRYRLLETVREYAGRLLDEHGETGTVAADVAGWFLERFGPWSSIDRPWVADVGVELDNLRGLIPSIPAAQQEAAQQLACTIGLYHDARQSFIEGIRELTRYVDMLRQPSPARVSLLTTLANLQLRVGDAGAAEELVEEARALEEEHGAPDWDDVAVDRARGEIARRSGDLQGAVAVARAALERPRSDRGKARIYNLLGSTLGAMGDFEASYEACEAELELSRAIGDDGYIASAEGNLAETAMRLGDVEAAAAHQRECLDLSLTLGSPAMVAFSLIMAARVAGAREDWGTAVRLHAGGEALLVETGLMLYEDDRRESDALLAEARTRLGDELFEGERRAGRDLELTEAAKLADSVLESAESDGGSPPSR